METFIPLIFCTVANPKFGMLRVACVNCTFSDSFSNEIAHDLRYFVPAEENEKLEKLAAKLAKDVKCNFYVRHKTMMIPPSILQEHNIKFARVFCREIPIIFLNIH